MSEFSSLVQEYYTNPINNHPMDDATLSRHEGNPLCGDDITVYIKLGGGDTDVGGVVAEADRSQMLVTQWSYDGNVSMITQAASSFFSDLVVGMSVTDILHMTEQRFIDEGFEVSPRRRRARVIALLATRNALHGWVGDGLVDDFEKVLISDD